MASLMGVYGIYCAQLGTIYIGSSERLLRRLCGHRAMLRGQRHPSKQLQADWIALGEGAFTFHCLETVDKVKRLTPREQYWVDRYIRRAGYKLYNVHTRVSRPTVIRLYKTIGDYPARHHPRARYLRTIP